ncbi:hypothetical protein SJI00_03635 [Pseudomonas sp. RP23018S]|uniref:hypothetical protein n=1 Tax=Pseudomonas sp. RP23018S TaxID=3096037 RepID=UPI002ACAC915|nr:hypothetical protein [Pseudomonas sp. RP23018S]MDZ5601869.1 hypothetical protein [Pseudomonas sp. RP23018S]
MDLDLLKQRLGRPATRLVAGGFRPTDTDDESWLGRVFLFAPDQALPLDAAGEPMLPIGQFHLPTLIPAHPQLEGVRVLTLFMSRRFPEPFEPMGANWLIREYGKHDTLVRKDLAVAASPLKAFALKSHFVERDCPLWDGGGVPLELEREVLALMRSGDINSYYDITTHCYEHKFGGFPSFCQAGVEPPDGFEFVFQVSSDAKINLNVVDSGSLLFWKNARTGEWAFYYDFY